MIYLLGLGPGDPRRLPAQALELLLSGRAVFARTLRHPVWSLSGPLSEALSGGSVSVTPLDDEYETNQSFEDTYEAIVARLLRAAASEGEIVYAVPGHPLIGETTIAMLLARTRAAGVPTRIVGAPSFIDACLEVVGEAVTDDLHVVDALSLDPRDPSPPDALRAAGGPILLYQVHSRAAASDAKLALMRAGYPDEHSVAVIHAAGVPDAESVHWTPLFQMDRESAAAHAPDHLTSVWVPALQPGERRPGFAGLVRVMGRLRDPENGCPWDLKQTRASLKRYLIEEAYEVIEAIDDLDASPEADPEALCEELGDVLLQVVFHAQLASEEGFFDAEDVCSMIVAKLVRRHPHIFGDAVAGDAEAVLKNWNAIKAGEKGKEHRDSVLDGVPRDLPALSRALEISRRAVKVGFEWPDIGGVLAKVDEELAEVRAEIEAGAPAGRIASELGDLLFTIVNLARQLGIDPEDALRDQLGRFSRRFQHIESGARAQNRPIESLSLAEMETLWSEAKAIEQSF